ncbi:hypothetical protein [Martelella mediterranea]|uniref:Uncharacterized protein n=1 Tax=Martelella mediterranea TaxID=293089 RepID=A0A4R3NI45_9HYPH|nr:hypothetical protein [Martelella mediterranea]TCT31464.1 hypothetical protein EDC90_104219 [Martelella mediterranea]
MFASIKRFFQRLFRPRVDESETEGVKHVIDNIDSGFEKGRPNAFSQDEKTN